jgi:predicted DNA-binding protein
MDNVTIKIRLPENILGKIEELSKVNLLNKVDIVSKAIEEYYDNHIDDNKFRDSSLDEYNLNFLKNIMGLDD